MIALVVTTDGRGPLLQRTLESAELNLPQLTHRTIVDDSDNAEYAEWLDHSFSNYRIVHHATRRGLGGAVRSAWTEALHDQPNYIFHCEDDFTFNEPVDLEWMTDLLAMHSKLAQVSLKRQPVNDVEISAGDWMKVDPSRFTNCYGYVEHETLFTFNPMMVPAVVAQLVLNDLDCDMLERGVTDVLSRHGYKFGIFGHSTDAPRVTHIGDARSNGWHT